MGQYSTELTDIQWQAIEKIINPQERQRKLQLRDIMNAILYIKKTGCLWQMLPSPVADGLLLLSQVEVGGHNNGYHGHPSFSCP